VSPDPLSRPTSSTSQQMLPPGRMADSRTHVSSSKGLNAELGRRRCP
jgi:hypothetical protein